MEHNPYTPPRAKVGEPDTLRRPGKLAALSLGPRILFAIGWFLFCGGYSIWWAWQDRRWPGAIAGVIIVLASLGVVFRWRWSKWIIYAFVGWASGLWLYLLWGVIRAGRFPLETAQATALSLVPGLSVLFASVWSADIVRRRFRRAPTR